MVIRKAKALRHLLQNKPVKIFQRRFLSWVMGSHRKSTIIQPGAAGAVMSEEILWMGRRRTNPYPVPWKDRLKLLVKVLPYWLTRNMVSRAFGWYNPRLGRYVLDQLGASYYLINESGGIGHFLPAYDRMITRGIRGYVETLDETVSDLHARALPTMRGGSLPRPGGSPAGSLIRSGSVSSMKSHASAQRCPWNLQKHFRRRSSRCGSPTWRSASKD